MILLISNPSHPGIRAVALAYKKAFEFLGIEFKFLDFREDPSCSVNEVNAIIQWKLTEQNYDTAIFIQPSYLTATTFTYLAQKKNRINFVCIDTEDPYSTEVLYQYNSMFHHIFTNELTVAKQLGAEYLPLAYDSFQPFKYSDIKDIDFGFVSTFYPERYAYLEKIKGITDNVYAVGSVAPSFKFNMQVDLSLFSETPGLISRHKELEVYSNCKIVINSHRSLENTGRMFFRLSEGTECRQLFKMAVSPNPRFFDAITCGAYPLNDASRTECFEIIKKYDVNPADAFTLPPLEKITPELLKKYSYFSNKKIEIIQKLSKIFKEKETYLERAKVVLNKITN